MTRSIFIVGLICLFGCGPTPSNTPHNDADVGTDSGDSLADNWSWIEIDGSTCGNGTPAGIGISEGNAPSRLMIFFAGGGACWDTTSCYIVGSAVNIETTFNQDVLERELAPVENSGLIDRQDGPFAEATMVYVPYCTADLHSGDAVGAYDGFNPNRQIHHQGAVNIEAYLEYLSQTYPDTDEVFAVGISAGGYGAMINHHRMRAAFDGAPVHVLADGSPMVQPREGRWTAWKNAWNMQFPPGCEDCDETFPDYAAHVVDDDRDSRFALLTFSDDHTIAIFFAYALDGIGSAISSLVDQVYPDEPGGHSSAFSVDGTDHVTLQYYETLSDGGGYALRDFVDAWAVGD